MSNTAEITLSSNDNSLENSSNSTAATAIAENVFSIFQVKAERDIDDEMYARYEYVTSFEMSRALVNVHLSELSFRPYVSNAMDNIFSEDQRRVLRIWEHEVAEAKTAKSEGRVEESVEMMSNIKDSTNADIDIVPLEKQADYLKHGTGAFDSDYTAGNVKFLDSSNVNFRNDDPRQISKGYFNKALPVPFAEYFKLLDKWQLFQEFKLWQWLDFHKDLQKEDDAGLVHSEDLDETSSRCGCTSFCCFGCKKIFS